MTKRGKRRLLILVVLCIVAVGGVWGLRKFRHFQYEQSLVEQRNEGLELLARGDLTDAELDDAILKVGRFVRSELGDGDIEAKLALAALRVQRPLPGDAHINTAYLQYASVLTEDSATDDQKIEALEGIVSYAPRIGSFVETASAAADLITDHGGDTDVKVLEAALIAARQLDVSAALDRIADHLDPPQLNEDGSRPTRGRWERARVIADRLIELEPTVLARRIARLAIDDRAGELESDQIATLDEWINDWVSDPTADGRMQLLKAFKQMAQQDVAEASRTILAAAERGANDPIILSDMLGALRSMAVDGDRVAHREAEINLLVSTIDRFSGEVWPWERRVWWAVRTADIDGALDQLEGGTPPLISVREPDEGSALAAVSIPDARPIPAEILSSPMIQRWRALSGLLADDSAMISAGLDALESFVANEDAASIVRQAMKPSSQGLSDLLTDDPSAAAATGIGDATDANVGDRRIRDVLADTLLLAQAFGPNGSITAAANEDAPEVAIDRVLNRLRAAGRDARGGDAVLMLVAPPPFLVDLVEGRLLRARGEMGPAVDRLTDAARGWVPARLELAGVHANRGDHRERAVVLADIEPERIPPFLEAQWMAECIAASLDFAETTLSSHRDVLLPGDLVRPRLAVARLLHANTRWTPVAAVLYARSLAAEGDVAVVDALAEEAILESDPAASVLNGGRRPSPVTLYQLGEATRQLGREAAAQALLETARTRLAEAPADGPDAVRESEFLALQIEDGLAKLAGDLDTQIRISEQIAALTAGSDSELIRWNSIAARIGQGEAAALVEAAALAGTTTDIAVLRAMLESPQIWSPPRALLDASEPADIGPYRDVVDLASQRFLEVSPANSELPRIMRALYLITYFREGTEADQKQAEALQLIDAAEEASQTLSPDAAYLKALMLSELPDNDPEIIGLLSRAIEVRPSDPRPYGLLLPALRRTGDRETLGRIVRRMAGIFGERPSMQPVVISALLEDGQLDAALDFVNRFSGAFSPAAASLLAARLQDAGRLDEAIAVAERAVASTEASTTDLRRVASVEAEAFGVGEARDRLTSRLEGRSERDIAAANAGFILSVDTTGRPAGQPSRRDEALEIALRGLRGAPGDAELFQLAMSAAEGVDDGLAQMRSIVIDQARHLDHSPLVDGIIAIAMRSVPTDSLPADVATFVERARESSTGLIAGEELAERVAVAARRVAGGGARPEVSEAQDALRIANRIGDDARVWVLAIRMAELTGSTDRIGQAASDALTEGPATADIALAAFAANLSVGSNDRAATAARQWVTRAPAPAIEPRLQVANFLLATNRTEEAREVVAPLLDLDASRFPTGLQDVARQLHLRALARSDARSFEERLAEAIDSDIALSDLGKVVVDAPLAVARDALERLGTQLPDAEDTIGLAEAWTMLGARHDFAPALEQAKALAEPLVDSDQAIGAYTVLAQASVALDDDVEAERWYRAALALAIAEEDKEDAGQRAPGQFYVGGVVIRNNLASLLILADRDCSDAVALAQAAVARLEGADARVRGQLRQVEAPVRGTLSEALVCVGESERALNEAEVAARLAPSNAGVLTALAIAQEASGSTTSARRTARQVRDLIDDSPFPTESTSLIELLERYEL